MATPIRPAMVAQRPIKIVFHENESFDAPACVERQGEEKNPLFLISVYQKIAREIFYRTPLSKLVPYQTFENALILHEIAHVNAGTMDKDPLLAGNGIYDTIANILADTHDEYVFCAQYPNYSKYIELALSVLKYKSPAPEDSNLGVDLGILYKMIRFGIVHNSASDTEKGAAWVSFIFSLMHSAIRGNAQNTEHAAQALYWFLYERNNDEDASKADKNIWDKAAQGSGNIVLPLTAQDIKDMQDGQGNEILSGSAHLETLGQVTADAKAVAQQVPGGKGTPQESTPAYYAGLSSEPLIQETDDEFYQHTVLSHEKQIEQLRRAFLMCLEHPDWQPSYDGEMNMETQEQAYEDSFTGEEGEHYTEPRPVYPDMRAVVLADISYSTDAIKVAYAQAKIIFLAALEDIPGVYTGEIDFNNNAHVNKTFAEALPGCAMHPYAAGGTSLFNTLQELSTWDFSAKHNMVFIITDGAIYDWESDAAPWFLSQEQTCGMEAYVIEIVESYAKGSHSYGATNWKNFLYSTLEDLPGLMAEKVIPHMGVVTI